MATDDELRQIMERLTPELRDSLQRYHNVLRQGTQGTQSAINRWNSTISAGSASLSTSYNGFVDLLSRTAREQQQPIEVGLDALMTAFKTSETMLKSFGGPAGALAGSLTDRLQSAIKGAGGAIASLAGSLTGVAGDVLTVFATQLVETYNNFKILTRSGVVLGGGITELAQLTKDSGLPIKAFTTGLTKARADLSAMGVGAGQATQRVSNVMGELVNGADRYTESLGALGYSTDEQVALVASQLANDRAAGVTRVKSTAELAKDTLELGKNMRILSDLTGQDAKQLMEKARAQSLETDLYKRAMKDGGPDAVKRMQSQLTALQALPENVRAGVLEMISTGGEATTDIATNLMMDANAELRPFIQGLVKDMRDPSLSPAEAQKRVTQGLERVGKAALESSDSTVDSMSQAARLTKDGTLTSVKNYNDALIQLGVRMGEGATTATTAAADKLADGVKGDKLTKTAEEIARLGTVIQSDMQNTLRAPMNELAGGIKQFTEIIASGTTAMRTYFTGGGRGNLPAPTPETPAQRPGREGLETPAQRPGREGLGAPAARPGREGLGAPTPRALGGEVLPNRTYLVGERGPELLVAREMASVISNDQSKMAGMLQELSQSIRTGTKTETTESSRIFQNEMMTVMREQLLLMKNNVEISREMLSSMEEIYSVQTRIAEGRT